MINKIKKTLFVLGFSLIAGVTVAHAVPLIIDTEQGTCYYSGENQYNYIYTCQNGALWYISKNQGGGGGNNDDDDNGCPPTAIFC